MLKYADRNDRQKPSPQQMSTCHAGTQWRCRYWVSMPPRRCCYFQAVNTGGWSRLCKHCWRRDRRETLRRCRRPSMVAVFGSRIFMPWLSCSTFDDRCLTNPKEQQGDAWYTVVAAAVGTGAALLEAKYLGVGLVYWRR